MITRRDFFDAGSATLRIDVGRLPRRAEPELQTNVGAEALYGQVVSNVAPATS
jgi:hypothetical protein